MADDENKHNNEDDHGGHGGGHDDDRDIRIRIDRVEYEVHVRQMTGAELRHVPSAPIGPDRDLFEVVPGADDIKTEGEVFEVLSSPHAHEAVATALKAAGIEPDQAEIGKYADTLVALEGTKAQQMLKMMEALEDNDDTQNVWANFDISEKEMEEAAAS